MAKTPDPTQPKIAPSEQIWTLLNTMPNSDGWRMIAEQADSHTLQTAAVDALAHGHQRVYDALQPYLTGQPTTAIATVELADEAETDALQTIELTDDETNRLAVSAEIGRFLGRRQMSEAITKLVTVTSLLDLQKIKEFKQYKGLVIHDENGKLVTVTTFAKFCELVVGRPVASVDNDLRNLAVLGPELVESMQAIGIGPGTMRSLRQIPADERNELVAAAKTANKDEFLELAESLIERHLKEKTKLTTKTERLETELSASRARVENLRRKSEELEDELHKNDLRTPTMDETMAELVNKLTQFMSLKITPGIAAGVRSGVKQLIEYGDAHDTDWRQFVAGLFCNAEREFALLRHDFGIPSRPDGDGMPDWVRGTDWGKKILAEREAE